jgi:hypothetical protein
MGLYYYNGCIQIVMVSYNYEYHEPIVYMDSINKKRTQWRNNIRRQDLEEQKRKIRKEVTNKDHRDYCISLIQGVI